MSATNGVGRRPNFGPSRIGPFLHVADRGRPTRGVRTFTLEIRPPAPRSHTLGPLPHLG